MESRLRWEMGWAYGSDFDMRRLFSTPASLRQLLITKSAVTGVPSGQAARLVM
jgi:hypothetical protein